MVHRDDLVVTRTSERQQEDQQNCREEAAHA
jgi:glutamate 5-kinase